VEIVVPEPSDLLAGIANVSATVSGERRSIAEWRKVYLDELTTAPQQSDIAIFNRFINSLLERAMRGDVWTGRMKVIQDTFLSFDDVTPEHARDVLKQAGYRFPEAGRTVILDAKHIVTDPAFTWRSYLEQADSHYESDFQEDRFLGIKGVSFKTRDLALSELSEKFVAVDLHVVRVTSRTGLLVHGYGDPQIATDVAKANGYLFFHDLMLRLARRTGWPGAGYSPGEMDRMLWNFGRAVCGAKPKCGSCPVAGSCLTSCGRVKRG